MKKLFPFVAVWLTNSLLLYLASMLYPANYVLGNFRMGSVSAALAAGFVWALLTWLVKPLASKFNIGVEGYLQKTVFYFVANFVALWVTARMAPVVGFGVSSFIYVLGLALVAEFAQMLVWKFVSPLSKKL